MEVARRMAKRARVGVLCAVGPRYTPTDQIDRIAAAKLDFVRLAFMPTDFRTDDFKHVERAKALGLTVSINLMQTYVLPPDLVARRAAEARKAGADWFYVVDSAGGMRPAEVGAYVRAIRDATGMTVGLHAHNNRGLAVANALAAIEAGATLVDGTLQGMGRATGNPPTAQLLLALKSMGQELDVDMEPVLALSSMFRMFEDRGTDPVDFVSGAAQVHSRNVPEILGEARRRGLSRHDLILRVGAEAHGRGTLDASQHPPELYDAAARDCLAEPRYLPSPRLTEIVGDRLAARAAQPLARLADELAVRAARLRKRSLLHLVPVDVFPFAGPFLWESETLVGASAAYAPCALAADRTPDFLLLDAKLVGATGLPACKRRRLTCAWDELWLDAAVALIEATCPERPTSLWMPAGEVGIGRRLVDRLRARELHAAATRAKAASSLVVAAGRPGRWTDEIRRGDRVLLLDRRPPTRAAVDAIRERGGIAFAPPVADVIGPEVELNLSLAERIESSVRLGAETARAGWVEPWLAPGRHQAVVDGALGSILDPGERRAGEVALEVAEARARALVSGAGKL
jgi:4-hydroxy 2-oxovalerate aldolase